MNRSRSIRPFALTLAAGCVLALGACGQHGNYTKEGVNQAEERMSMMKSGTEWQQAQQQFLSGDLDKALRTIDKSISINDKVSKAHVLKGRILMEQGRMDKSRESLLTAVELDDKNVEGHYYLGVVHERVNEPELALEQYAKAADLDTSNAQYSVAAAEMLIQMGKLDKADALLDERGGAMQYSSAIRQTKGQIALRNDPKKAVDLFSEALRLAPDDASVLEDLVRGQIDAGQFAEAEFNISRLMGIEANKDRRDLKQMRARCLLAVDRPVEARELLISLTSDDAGQRDVRAWTELGNVACLLGDRANLRTASQRVIALAPNQHEGYTFRAMLYRLEGQQGEALSSVQNAVKRAGNDAAPFLLKALILQDMGRSDEAAAALSKAVAMDPQDPAARQLLTALESGRALTTHPDAAN